MLGVEIIFIYTSLHAVWKYTVCRPTVLCGPHDASNKISRVLCMPEQPYYGMLIGRGMLCRLCHLHRA